MPFLSRVIRHLTVTPRGAGSRTNSSRLATSSALSAVGDPELPSWEQQSALVQIIKYFTVSGIVSSTPGVCVTHWNVLATGGRGWSGVSVGGQGARSFFLTIVLMLAVFIKVHTATQTWRERGQRCERPFFFYTNQQKRKINPSDGAYRMSFFSSQGFLWFKSVPRGGLHSFIYGLGYDK